MRLFGEPVPRGLPEVMGRVGAVVEQPKFVPDLHRPPEPHPARRTRRRAHARGSTRRSPRSGSTGRDKERYKGYSLGMKQRLAIAATLLKSPDLLILDEPTNGLDPAGIRDIRTMIRDLGESGVTVLLSSHILAEVQQVCHSVSIIGNGRLLASGPVEDLVGEQAVDQVRVGVADPAPPSGSSRPAGGQPRRRAAAGRRAADPAEASPGCWPHQVYVRELTPVRADLESVFLQLTGPESLEADLDRTPDGAPMTRLARVELRRLAAAPADALRRPRHPAGGRAAAVPDRLLAGRCPHANGRPVSADYERARQDPRRTASSSARTSSSPRPEAAHGDPRPTSAATRGAHAASSFLKPELARRCGRRGSTGGAVCWSSPR